MPLEDKKSHRRADFRTAVGQDCMGWFCQRYGIGAMEYQASSPMHLIELVAAWIVEQERKEKE